MAHKHSVYDTDAHFRIDPITRAIKNETPKKITLIQFDHNSERFSFDMPRYIDGHDMMMCNLVEVHFTNTDTKTAEANSDFYEVKDMQISPDDEEKVVFSWLIDERATQYAGSLEFLIKFKCMTGGVCDYRWNTANNNEISISSGKDNSGTVVELSPNVVDQWREEIFGNAANAVVNINIAEQEAIEAVKDEGAAQVENVKETAAVIEASREQIHRNATLKASVIAGSAEGETILLDDSAEMPFAGMNVFGKSTQNGTPTPEAPVEINSVENAKVGVYGVNFIDAKALDVSSNTELEVLDDGYTIKATGGTTSGWCCSMYELPEELVRMLRGKKIFTKCDSFVSEQAGVGVRAGFNVTLADGTTVYPASVGVTNMAVAETINKNAVRIIFAVYANNSGNILETDNTVVIKGLRVSILDFVEWDSYKEFRAIPLPYTLHGIPVTSSGNYTDADGQQWICDEIDLANGKYIQRCEETVLNGETSVLSLRGEIDGTIYVITKDNNRYIPKTNLLSDKLLMRNTIYSAAVEGIRVEGTESSFGLRFRIATARLNSVNVAGVKEFLTNNPIRVVAPLVEPIEIPLSEDELAAFKALVTNYPTTTILNDSGANMAVRYGIDTKTYIDKKFEELKTAILEEE